MPQQMPFCDRETIREAIEGKFIALVGSGPGLLMNAPGFVDSHEVVIRVNNYALTGHITGKRTDIFYSFFGSSVRKKTTDLIRDGVKLCMAKCPDAQFMQSDWHEKHNKPRGVDFRYIYEQRRDWWFCPTYVPTVDEFMANFAILGDHVPTTGFAALLDVLSYNPQQVYMTGFDFFQSKIHNVHERWTAQNPDDPIGHVPDSEREWLLTNKDHYPITMDEMLRAALHNGVRPHGNPSNPRRVVYRRIRAA